MLLVGEGPAGWLAVRAGVALALRVEVEQGLLLKDTVEVGERHTVGERVRLVVAVWLRLMVGEGVMEEEGEEEGQAVPDWVAEALEDTEGLSVEV